MKKKYKKSGAFCEKLKIKECISCGETKSFDMFFKSVRLKSGLQTYCKKCQTEKMQNDRIFNKDRRLSIERLSRERHWEKNTWNWIRQRIKGKNIPLCSSEEFLLWMREQKRVCTYCGITDLECKKMFKKNLAVDRKVPEVGYQVKNITLACHRCNVVKNKYLSYEQMIEVANKYFIKAEAKS